MKKISVYAAAALMAIGFSACSNEDAPSIGGSNVVNFAPVQQSVVTFSSNGVSLMSAGSRAEGMDVTYGQCSTNLIDREHEKEIIEEWLPEKNGNLKEGINSDFLFYADEDMSLEFYPVYSMTTTPNDLGLFYYDANGEYHEMIIWENMNPWGLTETEWKWDAERGSYAETTSKGIQINVPAGCKFGFFWKGNGDNGAEMTYYSSSNLNEEVHCTDGGGARLPGEPTSKIHAVTFTLEGKTYLGLEDWTDFDFQDWVFTCDRELKTVPSDDIYPENPGEEPEQPGVEPEEPGEEPEQPGVEPEEPETPGVVNPAPGKGHVEVNFAVDDRKGDYLESHLSVHVRDTTDFRIFIPVPAEYYCPEDDMQIIQKKDHDFTFNTTVETVEMVIGDDTVTLTITYAEDGITIESHGITADVLKHCREKYGDGLTFEIRNYYNNLLSLEELRYLLSKARISFADGTGMYINSYGEDGRDGDLNCLVTPEDSSTWNATEEETSTVYTKK